MEMKKGVRVMEAIQCCCVLIALVVVVAQLPSSVVALKNCSRPAIYAFGDSLTDVGNSIAAFPDQFYEEELDMKLEAYGVEFPKHGADRWSDGKLLVDFLEFGFRGEPNYAWLRSVAGDFEYGTNFAASGGSARNSTKWKPFNGFNTPFSLNLQLEWLDRYMVHLFDFYLPVTTVKETLPSLASLNQSLYMVYAGYQDYFFDLYDKKVTPRQGLDTVPDVVSAIVDHIEGLIALRPEYLMVQEVYEILVVNLPPLGCIPALLTLYPGTPDAYNSYGCLTELNKITSYHNKLLGEKVVALRKKYPKVTIYYGDVHGVYTDILSDPLKYNVTETLKAVCGYGGKYNFNTKVKCGEVGIADDGKFLNLTMIDHTRAAHYLSFDGIHLSNTANKAIAIDFFTGKHITPEGGFNCSADFSRFDGRT